MFSGLTLLAFTTDVFPADYFFARKRWRLLLSQGLPSSEPLGFPCPDVGPNGEELVTDTVWIGPEDAEKVVVVVGGTHGIEGFAGSAVQIDHLQLIASKALVIPGGIAVLLIHALTPWGYAWLRRCDAEGVDLNRNFVDFSKQLPKNLGYDRLRPALFSVNSATRKRMFAEFEEQYGRTAFEQAISGGQYVDPAGPFYGGTHPAHGRLVTEALIKRYALQQRDLAVIDVHTGLGPYGYGEIICDHEPDSAGTAAARRYYGDSVTLPLLGTSTSVPKSGLLDYAWHRIMNDRSCYVTLEFGTFSTDHLFAILLKDHLLWARPGGVKERTEHGQTMRRHFCPSDRAWQEMVLFRARQVIAQALRGIANADR